MARHLFGRLESLQRLSGEGCVGRECLFCFGKNPGIVPALILKLGTGLLQKALLQRFVQRTGSSLADRVQFLDKLLTNISVTARSKHETSRTLIEGLPLSVLGMERLGTFLERFVTQDKIDKLALGDSRHRQTVKLFKKRFGRPAPVFGVAIQKIRHRFLRKDERLWGGLELTLEIVFLCLDGTGRSGQAEKQEEGRIHLLLGTQG